MSASQTLVIFYEMTRSNIPEDFFEDFDSDDNDYGDGKMAPSTALIDCQQGQGGFLLQLCGYRIWGRYKG
jgi:hypothetical protein